MLAELIGAKKDYGKFQLDCSFQVKGGSVIGLIGANGAGKSTTFKLLLNRSVPQVAKSEFSEKMPGNLLWRRRKKSG